MKRKYVYYLTESNQHISKIEAGQF